MMQVIEHLRAEILQSFGGIGKGLFKPIPFDPDMPDDLALIWLERNFCLRIDPIDHKRSVMTPPVGKRLNDRIDPAATGHGILEEMINIIIPQTF